MYIYNNMTHVLLSINDLQYAQKLISKRNRMIKQLTYELEKTKYYSKTIKLTNINEFQKPNSKTQQQSKENTK